MAIPNQKISVALATYNGAKYIKLQLLSILGQIGEGDEVIISDNYSTDNTIAIIKEIGDRRVKIFFKQQVSAKGSTNCYFNFENALKHCNGDIVFLSDQDDVWKENKVHVCLNYLQKYDLVVTDCSLTSEAGEVLESSYFKIRESGTGFFKNLKQNTYIGCCMAFKKQLLQVAMPFPKKMPMHDILLGTIADLFFKPIFIPKALLLYREHSGNVSATSAGKSPFGLTRQLGFRLRVIQYLPLLLWRKLWLKE
ncbi:glycosyltransferase family 2 protein [Parasediminibacterium sp. JCM 36343]|uniref:glycosyltransferase family 2 protein n=1 Tax=Parasediminibacterium sp. JCM 36343 TaxID=3374279 RepID=UPI00397E635E